MQQKTFGKFKFYSTLKLDGQFYINEGIEYLPEISVHQVVTRKNDQYLYQNIYTI